MLIQIIIMLCLLTKRLLDNTPCDTSQSAYYVLTPYWDETALIRTYLGVTATASDTNYLRSNAFDIFEGTTSGRFLRFQCFSGRTANSSSGNLFPLEVFQATPNTDAAITFHISNDYAAYFGLDGTTNDLFYGGWSAGAAKYKVWHAANDGSGSGLDADLLDGISSASFLRSDIADTYTRLNTVSSTNNARFQTSSSWGTRHQTDNGYIDFGPANTSWAHIYTDRPNFYFNKDLYVNGSKVWHAGNDGAGSGLDADTVDGIEADRIPYGSNTFGTTGATNPGQNLRSGFFDVLGTANGAPTNTWYSYINIRHTNTSNGWGHQIAGSFYDNGDLYNRHYDSGNYAGWTKIWNAANDGAGSGLDADLLDGQQGSYYLNYNNLTNTPTAGISAAEGQRKAILAAKIFGRF